MQESTISTVSETKRLIRWIGQNLTTWDSICGKDYKGVTYFDSITIIKELQENKFYPQILSLAFSSQNGIEDIALNAIVEEILETWDKEQWDEVINKMLVALNEAHQEAKRQRAEATNPM